MNPVVRSAIETAVVAAVAAPLIALGMWRSRLRVWSPLIAFLGLLLLDNVVLRLPRAGLFASLHWNWQGKLLEVAWVLALVTVSRRLSLRDIGVTAPLRPGWLAPTLVVGAITLGLPLAFTLLGARDPLTVEGWCFEATMPGIAEEMVYRGVLLELCDRSLGRPWRIAGADVGWGAVITAVVFAAGHAIAVDRSGVLQVEPLFAVGPLVGSLLAGWARSRLGALAPLIILHNASNLVIPLATLWM
jgi:membrane protease YdiL (CAAX protease family)